VITGGAPVTDDQLRRWVQAFPDTQIDIAYGSTEAEPVAHIRASDRLLLENVEQGYCVGKISPSIQARVIRIFRNEEERDGDRFEELLLPDGEIGELVVCGQYVCRDYYQNPRATSQQKLKDATGNVWHRMGDTGKLDLQGRFWLAGRVHSTIVRNGITIHPQLTEQALARLVSKHGHRHRRVAVVGMPNDSLGQACWIVIEPIATCARTADDWQAAFHSRDIPCDQVVVLKQSIPVDPRHNSKIDYVALQQLLMEKA